MYFLFLQNMYYDFLAKGFLNQDEGDVSLLPQSFSYLLGNYI